MTPNPELVIFDCDGVLVDSERIAVEVDLMVFNRLGLEISRQELIERFVGRSPSVMHGMIEDVSASRCPRNSGKSSSSST